jgi:hypothetical protein
MTIEFKDKQGNYGRGISGTEVDKVLLIIEEVAEEA